jgi:protein SCO1/2
MARPDVTLTDTSGRPYRFAARTRGRVTLVYLGYTHCTDTCPAMMATLAVALRHIPVALARKIIVVFITTDPRRDTPHVMRSWLDKFNPSFVGLTGTQSTLAASYHAFGVDPKVVVKPSGAEEVEHSADMFAFGPDDRARISYDPDATPPDYEHDLPLLARGVTPPVPSAADLAASGGIGRAGLVKVFSAYLSPSADGRSVVLTGTLVNGADSTDSLIEATTDRHGRAHLLVQGRPVRRLTLRAQATLTLRRGAAEVALSALDRPVRPGDVVTMTLRFAGAGPLTMLVPVVRPRAS